MVAFNNVFNKTLTEITLTKELKGSLKVQAI
jgi:hypothetical protein